MEETPLLVREAVFLFPKPGCWDKTPRLRVGPPAAGLIPASNQDGAGLAVGKSEADVPTSGAHVLVGGKKQP